MPQKSNGTTPAKPFACPNFRHFVDARLNRRSIRLVEREGRLREGKIQRFYGSREIINDVPRILEYIVPVVRALSLPHVLTDEELEIEVNECWLAFGRDTGRISETVYSERETTLVRRYRAAPSVMQDGVDAMMSIVDATEQAATG